jgi:triphosphoribosyl-dephospho-CoA synthase
MTDLLGLHAQLACLWEATARKPGNVHRFRDFADTSYLDYAASAATLGVAIAGVGQLGVGATVYEAVRLRGLVAARNTNLGMALLLAALARASVPHTEGSGRFCEASLNEVRDGAFRVRLRRVLRELSVEDAVQVYRAIRLASPGGLGEAGEQDVAAEPTVNLREAMALSADRDLVARQYANDFADVFEQGAPAVRAGIERTGCVEGGILHAHLHLMANFPDSLIARKRGGEEARESAERARMVLEAGWPLTEAGRRAIVELDDWLRAVGHQRNPGTTADLVAASLFVLLREGLLGTLPERPWALSEGAP